MWNKKVLEVYRLHHQHRIKLVHIKQFGTLHCRTTTAARSVSANLDPSAVTAYHPATRPVSLDWLWASRVVRSAHALNDPDQLNLQGGAALCPTAIWSAPTGSWGIPALGVKSASVSHHHPWNHPLHPEMEVGVCATLSCVTWGVTSGGTETPPAVVKSAAVPKIQTPSNVSAIVKS